MAYKRFLVLLTAAILLGAGRGWADGLDANYGKDLPSVFDEGDKIEKLKGKEFKVLRAGVLEPGKSIAVKGVIYEKNAVCVALGYGRGLDSNLDVVVTAAKGGKELGKDELPDNFPLVAWQSGADSNVVDIRVQNAGTKACSFVLLANY
jgi:hypothetical protein